MHIVEKERLDFIQAQFDAGYLPDNKLRIAYNDDIIVGQGEYQLFYDLVFDVAEAMEKNGSAIIANMQAAYSFQEILDIFDQEFGSRIILIAGTENL